MLSPTLFTSKVSLNGCQSAYLANKNMFRSLTAVVDLILTFCRDTYPI